MNAGENKAGEGNEKTPMEGDHSRDPTERTGLRLVAFSAGVATAVHANLKRK